MTSLAQIFLFFGVDAGSFAHFASAVGAGSQMERATPRPRLPNRAWGTLRGRRRKERPLHCATQPSHGKRDGKRKFSFPERDDTTSADRPTHRQPNPFILVF